MTQSRARLLALAPWLAVLGLVAWSAWHRWLVLTASPQPVGIDGYFYAIQVRSIGEGHGLAYPAAPLTFYLMAAVALVADVVTSVKLVAAVGGALVAVPAFLLGRRLGRALGGLAAAVVAVTSGGSFFLSLEFVKNGLGLTLALAAVWLGLRALERPGSGRIAAAAAAVVAALLTHKMAAALTAAVLAPAIVVELVGRLGRARALRLTLAGAAAVAAAAIVLGLLAPARFVAGRDLAALASAVDGEPRWHLPAMYLARPGPDFALWFGDQAAIAAGLAVVAIALAIGLRVRGQVVDGLRPADRAAAWAAVVIVLVTAVPYLAVSDPDGLGFRLRVAVFAPAALVAALLVRLATVGLPAWSRAGLVLPVLVARVALVDPAPTEGVVYAHPALVAGMATLPGRLPPDAVIITSERHLGFMAAWFGRVPVRLQPGSVPPARRWRLLAGNRIGLGSPLDRALRDAHDRPGLVAPLGLHPRDPSGLVLVPEATWAWVLEHVPPGPAEYWRRWPTL
ncbi:MAG: glycosyltransferase family 39 protein [Kofleriaceae bacterium]